LSSNGKSRITVDQLLEEWRSLELPGQHRGQTTKEISEALNWPLEKTRDMLKRGAREGKIVNFIELRTNPFFGGRRYQANVWRVKKDGDSDS
jgi:hypothetical protein